MNRKEGDSLAKILILLLPILLLGVFFVSSVEFGCNAAYSAEDEQLCDQFKSLADCRDYQECYWEDNCDSCYYNTGCVNTYVSQYSSCSGTYNTYTQTIPESYYTCEGEYIKYGYCKGGTYWWDSFCAQFLAPSSCNNQLSFCYWQNVSVSERTVASCSLLNNSLDCGQYFSCSWTPSRLNTCEGTYYIEEEICECPSNDPECWYGPCVPTTITNSYSCSEFTTETGCRTYQDCNWLTYSYTPVFNSCTGLGESVCGVIGTDSYNCTPNYNCVALPPTATKIFGDLCASNSECTSGYCRNVLNATTGFSSEKRCADNATNCVFKKTTSPTSSVTYRAMSNEIHCTPSAPSPFVYRCENGVWDQLDQDELLGIYDSSGTCKYGCNIENIWLNPDGTTRSINNAVTPLTYVCVEEQSFKWGRGNITDAYFYGTSSQIIPLEIDPDSQVNLVVQNPVNTQGTFSLYEIDYPDEWTVTNFNLNDNLNSYLSAKETVLVNGVNMTYTTFTFSQTLINAISETEEGSVFEFKFEYDYDTGVNESVILYVLRSMDTCSNGIQDGDEGGVDCGGSCPTVCGCNFNGVCEVSNNENHMTCPCDCVPAGTKLLNWTFTYLEFSHFSEYDLSVGMRIYNPDSEDSTINLYEKDNLGADDLIKENVEGAYVVLGCGLPYISYSSLITTEDFVTASESDGDYEFYFTDGTTESPILTINLIGEIAQCGDGSCQSSSGEDELTCPSDCGACTEDFLVCGDYGNEGSCVSDNCDVSKSHGGECYWNTISVGCEERTTFEVGGVNIGSCLYSDDTSADDCSDSFLTYSWTAEWFWDPTNTEHYDPENMEASCVSGEATIPCPAQVQLSYFTWKNLVVAITLILVIYILIKLRQKGKKIKKEIAKKSSKKLAKRTSKKILKKKVSKKRK